MSAVSVPELLLRGASAPAHVSALDAVMGDDWAYLEIGRGGAVRAPVSEGRRTGARRRAALGGVLAPSPQALVKKLIGSGGTATGRGLKAQMAYLSWQGEGGTDCESTQLICEQRIHLSQCYNFRERVNALTRSRPFRRWSGLQAKGCQLA